MWMTARAYTIGRDAALITLWVRVLLVRVLADRLLDRVLEAALRPYYT
jgi:hypothetical protein